jgi:hypothetical protein
MVFDARESSNECNQPAGHDGGYDRSDVDQATTSSNATAPILTGECSDFISISLSAAISRHFHHTR